MSLDYNLFFSMSYYLLDSRKISRKGSKILNRPILTTTTVKTIHCKDHCKNAHLNELTQLNESPGSFKEKCFGVAMGVNRDKREGLGHRQYCTN